MSESSFRVVIAALVLLLILALAAVLYMTWLRERRAAEEAMKEKALREEIKRRKGRRPGDIPSPARPEGAIPPGEHEAVMAGLRKRFSEEKLKKILFESVQIEDAARREAGEAPGAYEIMEKGWSDLRGRYGISEREREALEVEAIRKKWPLPERTTSGTR